jgi:hypothetical protein
MTIQEAIKIGGLFRRESWRNPEYAVKVFGNSFYEVEGGRNTGHCFHPSNEDIIATDWVTI